MTCGNTAQRPNPRTPQCLLTLPHCQAGCHVPGKTQRCTSQPAQEVEPRPEGVPSGASSTPQQTQRCDRLGMVHLLSMVWRKILRKRWVLGVVFGLSLIYFLTSTIKQEERTVRDRALLQTNDQDQNIQWKVQFNIGNSSRISNQCRNSVQGKLLITDDLGYVCERKELLANGCCNINTVRSRQYNCESCLSNGCCSVYEYCVSCCLQPNKQHVLERFLKRAAMGFHNLFMAVEDHFELCLAKCRTSSQSVQHENTYRNPVAKYCYGESPPELLPM